MHSEDFRKDNCGVVSGLRDGGYSDDMTLAAIAGISLRLTLCHNQCFFMVTQIAMILSSSGAHKKLISSPPVAVFPHPLASDLNFGRFVIISVLKVKFQLIFSLNHSNFCRYWNYLRKQTFVLESYVTRVNQIMNRALFAVHCYLSWSFVAPYCMAVIHVAAALRFNARGNSIEELSYSSIGENTTFSFVISVVSRAEKGQDAETEQGNFSKYLK